MFPTDWPASAGEHPKQAGCAIVEGGDAEDLAAPYIESQRDCVSSDDSRTTASRTDTTTEAADGPV